MPSSRGIFTGASVFLLAVVAPALAAPTIITGTVLGETLQPLGGATITVIGAGCQTTVEANGAFNLPCPAVGPHQVQAALAGRVSGVQSVELGPDRLLHLNFLLAPAGATPAAPPAAGLDAPLGNPVLTTWAGHPITLRALGVVLAVAGFLLGFLAMLVVARGLGLAVERRDLGDAEAADLILNARRVGSERLQQLAVHGARGKAWSLSYGVEEIEALFRARRHGWLLASLLPPLLVATAATGFALALLVGQPVYLFAGMLLVPAGFLITPIVIVFKARAAALRTRSS